MHNSYGRILRSSTLLGGSSAINIGLGIIRTKVLAVQLGPALFGVMGLYTSLAAVLGGIASLGINQSAVREIAEASGAGDQVRIGRVLTAYRRAVWVTGLFGLLVTLLMAYPASLWMFGNGEHAWAIGALSLVVLSVHIQMSQMAVLQGLRCINQLTAVNVTGGIWSTLLAVPILLYFREDGVVPFLIMVAMGQLAASWWYARQICVERVQITWRETWELSREMVGLGATLAAAGVVVTGSAYAIRLIIQRFIGETGVGLYHAAFAISTIYVGFVLQAMAGDYYPRLAGVGEDRSQRDRLVNEQAEMAVLLAVPGLVAALVLSDVLIWALYSSGFDGASDILRWHVLGLLGRIIVWPMGFILLARADKKAFFFAELAAATTHVGLVGAGIACFGITGAGVAFAGQYLFYAVLIYWLIKYRHGYTWRRSTRRVILLGTFAVIATFGTTFVSHPVWRISAGGIILTTAVVCSLRGVVARVGHDRIARARQANLQRVGMATE